MGSTRCDRPRRAARLRTLSASWLAWSLLAGAAPGAAADAPRVDPRPAARGTLAAVAAEEYSFGPSPAGMQAPNRAQDLRVRVHDDGSFSIEPRRDGAAWRVALALRAISRGSAALPLDTARAEFAAGRATRDRHHVQEWLGNRPDGVEFGAFVRSAPDAAEGAPAPVRATFDLVTALSARVAEDGRAILFSTAEGADVLRCSELHVTDSAGRTLRSWFVVGPGALEIVIDDRGAAYPLSIDPLFTAPAWTFDAQQQEAALGLSAAAAGDVNGDGYSDVVVGAPLFDAGSGDEGRAFVFLGSASGPAATAAWTATGTEPGAQLGWSVSAAGDVDGDGFADVIVGAPRVDAGVMADQGAAYLYRGGSGGPSSVPAWSATGGQAGAQFGTAVTWAGDVDADGFDDVAVGARWYDTTATDAGRVAIFAGSASGLSASPSTTLAGAQSFAGFGHAVSAAGDVDGDGFGDLLVGEWNWDAPGPMTNAGRALLFRGGGSGLSATPAWTSEGTSGSALWGAAVAAAGDVNGDGYADVIVGGYAHTGALAAEGRAAVYLGSAAGLAAAPVWSRDGGQAGAEFGYAVASADLDADGYADVAVGAVAYDGAEADEGEVSVFFGGPTGPATSAGWSARGDWPGVAFGAAVASAGDVDGDGVGDLVVGAPNFSAGQFAEGRAFVFRGQVDGLPAAATWTDDVTSQANSRFGYAVSSAGDVNGDGYDDLIVGAPQFDAGGVDAGSAFVYYGSAAGYPPSPSWDTGNGPADARIGTSVSAAGDVNGDGYGDVVVGAQRYGNGQAQEGAAFVYLGSAGGLSAVPAWSVESNQASAQMGYTVHGGGDVDGDGYADVLVGAWVFDVSLGNEGRAWLYRGSASGLSTTASWSFSPNVANARVDAVRFVGDVNGDGFSDVGVGSSYLTNGQVNEGRAFVFLGGPAGPSTTPSWTAESDQTSCFFGNALSSAGDVDRDGYGDVLVGAWYCDVTTPSGTLADAGRAYVYRGGPGGLATTPIKVIEGTRAGAILGASVDTLGDVNADGHSDVVVGAPYYDLPAARSGRVEAWLGAANGLGSAPAWTAGGPSASRFGWAVALAGDANGDGFPDLVVGTETYDTVRAFFGGDGGGVPLLPRQARASGTAPIDLLGASDGASSFRLRATGRSAAGRTRVRLVREVDVQGVPFDGAGTVPGAAVDTGAPSGGHSAVALDEFVTGLTDSTFLHWRTRIRAASPLFPATRWLSPLRNGWSERDLRTSGPTAAIDADGDGVDNGADCDDADPRTWSLPGEATDIVLGEDRTTIAWTAPAVSGGLSLVFDVIRSDDASDFVSPETVCVETGGLDLLAGDAGVPEPGTAFFYLVRPRNDCGDGSLGARSDLTPRTARACECPSGCDDANACTNDVCVAGTCQHTPIPPEILVAPQNATVCAGEAASFAVAARGSGTLSYQWKKNGANVGTNSRQLTLPAANAGDDGAQITCVVTDGCSSATTAAARLTVFTNATTCAPDAPHGLDGNEPPNRASFAPDLPSPLPGGGASGPVGEVDPATGEFRRVEEDLRIRGRVPGMDFVWQRTYRSRNDAGGPLGVGWTHSYDLRVDVDPDNTANRRVYDGTGRRDVYAPYSGTCWSAAGHLADLCVTDDTAYTLTLADGTVRHFKPLDGSPAAGKVDFIADRNSNTLTFAYDGAGRLVAITDTLSRTIGVRYDANGRIAEVRDFVGRVVRYAYRGPGDPEGPEGDLATATLPAITGTPTGNDFPNGTTTTYRTSCDLSPESLNHDLLAVVSPRGIVVAEIGYFGAGTGARAGRVDGVKTPAGTTSYVYVAQTPAAGNNFASDVTIVNDGDGNVSESYADAGGRVVMLRQFTGRAPNKELPTDLSFNRPTGKLRATDPAYFETRYAWNADGLLTKTTFPELNEIERTYDGANPSRRLRGRLLSRTSKAGPRGGPAALTTSQTWATAFGAPDFWSTRTDEAGRVTARTYDAGGNLLTEHKPLVTVGVPGGGTQTVQDAWTYNGHGQVLTHTDPAGRVTEYRYDASGPSAGYLDKVIVDPSGLALTTDHAYGPDGFLVATTDPRGNTTRFVNNERGRLVRRIAPAPLGFHVDFVYDEEMQLTFAVDTTQDDTETRPNGSRSAYDSLGRVTRIARTIDPVTEAVTEFVYDAAGHVTLERSPEAVAGRQPGAETAYLRDERGLPWRTTRGHGSPRASTRQLDYDGNGNVLAERAGLEAGAGVRVTTRTYDGHDRQIAWTDPEGNVRTFAWDAVGNRTGTRLDGELEDGVSGANVRLEETVEVFDELHRRVTRTRFLFDPATQMSLSDGSSINRWAYAPDSRPVRTEDDNGAVTLYAYDTARRLTAVTDALQNQLAYTLDPSSNVALVTMTDRDQDDTTHVESRATAATYDALDRRTSETLPGGGVRQYVHDARGEIVTMIDPRGNAVQRTVDAGGRLLTEARELRAGGTGAGALIGTVTTTSAWDANDRLVSRTDANGRTTFYAYDELGRQTTLSFADGTSRTTTYDLWGDVVQTTDPNGTVVTYTRDRLGRVTRRDVARAPGVQGETAATFAYDGAGRLIRAANDTTTITRRYDSLSQPLEEDFGYPALVSSVVTRTVDGEGRVGQIWYPSGRLITSTYDLLGRRDVVSGSGVGTIVDQRHIGPERIFRRLFGNGLVASREYGADADPTEVKLAQGVTTLDRLVNAYDLARFRTARNDVDAGETKSFGRDSLGRLTQTTRTGPGAGTKSIALDGAGNRTTVTGPFDPGAYTRSATVPEPADAQVNQYTTTPFDARTYDRGGNMLTSDPPGPGADAFTYDYAGRLTSFDRFGVSADYQYDPLGRRAVTIVSRGPNTSVTYSYYDGTTLIEDEITDPDTRFSSYVHAGRGTDPVFVYGPEGNFFVHTEDDGTPLVATDGAGAVRERYAYNVDGKADMTFDGTASSTARTGLPIGWRGLRLDGESGLLLDGGRSLDLRAGRYLGRGGRDPWRIAGSLGNGFTAFGDDPGTAVPTALLGGGRASLLEQESAAWAARSKGGGFGGFGGGTFGGGGAGDPWRQGLGRGASGPHTYNDSGLDVDPAVPGCLAVAPPVTDGGCRVFDICVTDVVPSGGTWVPWISWHWSGYCEFCSLAAEVRANTSGVNPPLAWDGKDWCCPLGWGPIGVSPTTQGDQDVKSGGGKFTNGALKADIVSCSYDVGQPASPAEPHCPAPSGSSFENWSVKLILTCNELDPGPAESAPTEAGN